MLLQLETCLWFQSLVGRVAFILIVSYRYHLIPNLVFGSMYESLFLDTTIYVDGGKGPKGPVTPVLCADLKVNEGSCLTVLYNPYGRVSPFMSVFSEPVFTVIVLVPSAPPPRRSLNVRVAGTAFMICDTTSLKLVAAGVWARRWPHLRGKGASFCFCISEQTTHLLILRKRKWASSPVSAPWPASIVFF